MVDSGALILKRIHSKSEETKVEDYTVWRTEEETMYFKPLLSTNLYSLLCGLDVLK